MTAKKLRRTIAMKSRFQMGHKTCRCDYSFTFRDYLWIAVLWILTVALRYFVCLVLLVATSGPAMAQNTPVNSAFMPGETLQYKVKWGFFRLGTILIAQHRCDTVSTGQCIISMSVQSSEGLPFINVHFVNNSRKSPTSLRVSEETIITGEDSAEHTTYRHNTATNMLYCENAVKTNSLHTLDSLRLEGVCYDALGLFMMARMHGAGKETTIVPTLNDFRVSETEIRYTDEVEEIKVAACDSPTRCRRIDGDAKWVGGSFAGMKGPFTGWISDDAASIPLRAELKIFLGSIVLELESTNRSDWKPSRVASNRAGISNASSTTK